MLHYQESGFHSGFSSRGGAKVMIAELRGGEENSLSTSMNMFEKACIPETI